MSIPHRLLSVFFTRLLLPVLGIQPPYLRLWRGKGSNLRFTFFSSPHLLLNWPGEGPPPSSCFHIQDGFGKRPFAFSVPTPCLSKCQIHRLPPTWGQEGGGNLFEPRISFLKSCTAFAFPSACFHKVTHRGNNFFPRGKKFWLPAWKFGKFPCGEQPHARRLRKQKKYSCCGGWAEGEAICCRQAPEPRKTLPLPFFMQTTFRFCATPHKPLAHANISQKR